MRNSSLFSAHGFQTWSRRAWPPSARGCSQEARESLFPPAEGAGSGSLTRQKLLDHHHSAPAKHSRKNFGSISTRAGKAQVGSLDFHLYEAATRRPRAPTGVVIEKAK